MTLTHIDEAQLAQAAKAERAGLAELQAERYAQAERHFRRALAYNPTHSLGQGQLGLALFHQGRHAEAAESLAEAVAALPADDTLHRAYGMVLEALGRPAEALGEYSASAMLNPGSALAHATLGRLALRTGDLNLAEEYLVRAVSLAADDPQAHADLATMWEQRGDPQRALDSLRRGAHLAPDDADLQYRYGQALAERGDLKGARAALTAAHALRPTDRLCIEALADVLLQLDATSELIRLYAQAIRCDPAQRGMYASQLSRMMSGRSIQQPEPLAARAASTGMDDGRRIAQLEQDLRANPGSAKLRSQLSILYLKAGRLDEAKQQIRLAEATRRTNMPGIT